MILTLQTCLLFDKQKEGSLAILLWRGFIMRARVPSLACGQQNISSIVTCLWSVSVHPHAITQHPWELRMSGYDGHQLNLRGCRGTAMARSGFFGSGWKAAPSQADYHPPFLLLRFSGSRALGPRGGSGLSCAQESRSSQDMWHPDSIWGVRFLSEPIPAWYERKSNGKQFLFCFLSLILTHTHFKHHTR